MMCLGKVKCSNPHILFDKYDEINPIGYIHIQPCLLLMEIGNAPPSPYTHMQVPSRGIWVPYTTFKS